jgi:RTX calcium-binding nonapeptide repeat (4 copies)
MISNELMLSILAMDSYNRGYSPGIAGLSDNAGTNIGNATIVARSSSQAGSDAVSAGFYALSYSWNRQTVISYRGTDDVGILSGASDFWRGWITGAGHLVPGGQAQLAIDFYNSAASGNVILTGHSLGGGLAGFVGSFTHDPTLIFDHMPYIVAATTVEFFQSGLDVDTSNINSIYVDGEILFIARVVQFAIAGLVDPLLAPIILPLAFANLAGETQAYLLPHAENQSSFFVLHHQALVPILLFAVDEARARQSFTGWQSIGTELLDSIYNGDVAVAAGFLRSNVNNSGSAPAENKMAMALAYSAIDEGTLVFGDTGIRAMFDDANELGGVIGAGHATSSLRGAMAGLVEAFVQYAGMLAFNKVDSTGQNSVNPLQGVISLLTGTAAAEDASRADTLIVDLSDARWNMGAIGQFPEIVGLDTIFTGALVPVGGVLAADDPYLITFRSLYANGSADPKAGLPSQVLERIEFSLSDSGVTHVMSEPGLDPLGVGDGTGARHVWMYAGGAGDDVITGNSNDNVLAGGAGADTIDGGAGFDIASYAGSSSGVKIDLTLETQRGGEAEGDTYKDIEGVRGSEKEDELIGDRHFNILIGGGNDTVISQRTAANLDENGAYLKDDEGKQIVLGTFDVLKGGSGYDTYEINSNVYWGNRRTLNGVIPEQIYQHVSAIVEDSDGKGILKHDGSRRNGQRQHDNCW